MVLLFGLGVGSHQKGPREERNVLPYSSRELQSRFKCIRKVIQLKGTIAVKKGVETSSSLVFSLSGGARTVGSLGNSWLRVIYFDWWNVYSLFKETFVVPNRHCPLPNVIATSHRREKTQFQFIIECRFYCRLASNSIK